MTPDPFSTYLYNIHDVIGVSHTFTVVRCGKSPGRVIFNRNTMLVLYIWMCNHRSVYLSLFRFVCSTWAHCEVHFIQLYLIKFVSEVILFYVWKFLPRYNWNTVESDVLIQLSPFHMATSTKGHSLYIIMPNFKGTDIVKYYLIVPLRREAIPL